MFAYFYPITSAWMQAWIRWEVGFRQSLAFSMQRWWREWGKWELSVQGNYNSGSWNLSGILLKWGTISYYQGQRGWKSGKRKNCDRGRQEREWFAKTGCVEHRVGYLKFIRYFLNDLLPALEKFSHFLGPGVLWIIRLIAFLVGTAVPTSISQLPWSSPSWPLWGSWFLDILGNSSHGVIALCSCR